MTKKDKMTNNDKITKKKKRQTRQRLRGLVGSKGEEGHNFAGRPSFYFHKHLQRLSFFLNR